MYGPKMPIRFAAKIVESFAATLKVAQESRLHFRRIKFTKKSGSWVFLCEEGLTKRNFRVFFIFDSFNLRTETENWVHGFVTCRIS